MDAHGRRARGEVDGWVRQRSMQVRPMEKPQPTGAGRATLPLAMLREDADTAALVPLVLPRAATQTWRAPASSSLGTHEGVPPTAMASSAAMRHPLLHREQMGATQMELEGTRLSKRAVCGNRLGERCATGNESTATAAEAGGCSRKARRVRLAGRKQHGSRGQPRRAARLVLCLE